jgi:hypothetical protein
MRIAATCSRKGLAAFMLLLLARHARQQEQAATAEPDYALYHRR